ncbi:uncharacterized protein LOC116209107 [Punica granatum]|uniref:DEAD-box ATP-dependent RNA helicase 48 n=2 Tax=Punica granatum TaxID=22663 RepID=A0A218W2S1_PUNGR|nr:uncharacterized protein LOC116209107 [Punica granatum]OWM67164.1 hypothetical protein CDL15_Pgr000616 [Punica granatum]PKI55914.1 hypothetical protein CRG98_023699 [Punica granatum]
MSILQIAPPLPHTLLSFSRALVPPSHHRLFLHSKPSNLTLPFRPAPIRMGGGPRTYPGGVSKWQWKRMQAKKAKQLLKARLTRERQIYEMRKRAELKAAVSELERPWEAVKRAPTLFSVSADEQLKVLADRFQKPGGFDMWTERDGPELFKAMDGLPSARFFPKGVVHSVKPYGKVAELEGSVEDSGSGGESELDEELDDYGEDRRISSRRLRGGELGSGLEAENGGVVGKQIVRYQRNRRNSSIGYSQLDDVEEGGSVSGSEDDAGLGEQRVGNERNKRISAGRMRGRAMYNSEDGLRSSGLDLKNEGKSKGRLAKKGISRKSGALGKGGSRESGSVRVGFDRKQRGSEEGYGDGLRSGRNNRIRESRDSDLEVYDMSLQEDGSYRL